MVFWGVLTVSFRFEWLCCAFFHLISADVRSLPFLTGCVFQTGPHSGALLWSHFPVSNSIHNTRCRLICASCCLKVSQTAVVTGCQLTFSTVLFLLKVLRGMFETAECLNCPSASRGGLTPNGLLLCQSCT